MRRQLQKIYWLGVFITFLLVAVATILTAKLKMDDTRSHLSAILQAASRWTMDSNEDLQSLANSISEVSPHVRITFLLDMGMILADSYPGANQDENHYSDPEIEAARNGEIGTARRFSASEGAYVLYMAQRVSPQLILRVSYPIMEIARMIIIYGAAFLLMFVAANLIQRRKISAFANKQIRQLESIRELLDGERQQVEAQFPELQPSIDSIAYRVKRLHEDYREIVRTMNMRSEFVANASHELRSPLTSVRGFAEMLDEGLADSPEERQLCISTIRTECDRMLAVIEDILHLSKADRPRTNRKEVAVRPVAEEVCKSLGMRALSKEIEITIHGETTVLATEQDIWEILYNLMDNAIRYGKQNGYVKILLSPGEIHVMDNGAGIPKSDQKKIFEPFYRVEETQDKVTEGTGLGLAITKTIVERNHGTITVESEPGKGTGFLVRFPERERIDEK